MICSILFLSNMHTVFTQYLIVNIIACLDNDYLVIFLVLADIRALFAVLCVMLVYSWPHTCFYSRDLLNNQNMYA